MAVPFVTNIRLYKDAHELIRLYNSDLSFRESFRRLLSHPKAVYKGRPLKTYLWLFAKVNPRYHRYTRLSIKPDLAGENLTQLNQLFTDFYKNEQDYSRLRLAAYTNIPLNIEEDFHNQLEQLESLPEGEEKIAAFEKFTEHAISPAGEVGQPIPERPQVTPIPEQPSTQPIETPAAQQTQVVSLSEQQKNQAIKQTLGYIQRNSPEVLSFNMTDSMPSEQGAPAEGIKGYLFVDADKASKKWNIERSIFTSQETENTQASSFRDPLQTEYESLIKARLKRFSGLPEEQLQHIQIRPISRSIIDKEINRLLYWAKNSDVYVAPPISKDLAPLLHPETAGSLLKYRVYLISRLRSLGADGEKIWQALTTDPHLREALQKRWGQIPENLNQAYQSYLVNPPSREQAVTTPLKPPSVLAEGFSKFTKDQLSNLKIATRKAIAKTPDVISPFLSSVAGGVANLTNFGNNVSGGNGRRRIVLFPSSYANGSRLTTGGTRVPSTGGASSKKIFLLILGLLAGIVFLVGFTSNSPSGIPGTTDQLILTKTTLYPEVPNPVNPDGSINVGSKIIYEISAEYTGVGSADIELTDALPNKTNYVQALDGGIFDASTKTVKWTLSNLITGQPKKVTFIVQPTAQDIWVQNIAEAKITATHTGTSSHLIGTVSTSLDELFTNAAKEAHIPLAFLKAIARTEGGVLSYTDADFAKFSVSGWWDGKIDNAPKLRDNDPDIIKGYGYNTCQYSQCAPGADVRGAMQFELGTWNGVKGRINFPAPDRRNLIHVVHGSAIFNKLNADALPAEFKPTDENWGEATVKALARQYCGGSPYANIAGDPACSVGGKTYDELIWERYQEFLSNQ